ncbi:MULTISPECIES: (2Fe-2S)-binding protein [Stenotrophomonas]|uniref:(2Fe-2S)-binding protein n=1 Tax=Stenotrophomonas sp. CFBP8994 TaxID=3096527 RepID=UPI002A6B70E3|nr:(2Fe-2S)-binding protein [Stenotrophomonas sp. CFBP8994]MDY0981786.1 (2Fe-2S)-binding protein [Stenotrophomonas sp. CFBP8994]
MSESVAPLLAATPPRPAPRPRVLYPLSLTVNGSPHALQVESSVSLLDLLRERLQLTGTKKGCDHGQCGACTVLVDGRRINSCLTLAVMQDGAQVQTIEGLADGDDLHPLQQAFIACDALQCGYCTPGQICSAQGLINEGKACSRDQVRELMSGNVCRCGAYPQITDAVMSVLESEQPLAAESPASEWVPGTVPA